MANCAKAPKLNQTWIGGTLVNENVADTVYKKLGTHKLFRTDNSFFEFIMKGSIEYNPHGLVKTIHGFTYPAMKPPIEPGTHLITRYYNTPGKKTYTLKGHYKFRTTISEAIQDYADIVDYQEIIGHQIEGVQTGEQQLMQYIFLKIFVSDEHIQKLGCCICKDGADKCCCALIPKTLLVFEPTDGDTNGYPAYQNYRTLEEVAGNHDANGKFKDFGVESATAFKPKPKIEKTNELKKGLEAIRTALNKNVETCVALPAGVHKNISDGAARKTLAMFLTAINHRDDMCGPIPSGKYTVGTECLKVDGKCTDEMCSCCLPSNFSKEDIVILCSTKDYRDYRDYIVKDAVYSGVSGEFEGMLANNGIYHDDRMEPGHVYVLHKDLINIWITETRAESDEYREHGIINRWYDRHMYIGHWCFLPGYKIKKQA